MATWTSLNMNARVKVKLTPVGYRVYKRHMTHLGVDVPLIPKVDAEGWYEAPLWEIAHIFGADIYNGCVMPFETDILVKSDGT
jgi:hypothetical protein